MGFAVEASHLPRKSRSIPAYSLHRGQVPAIVRNAGCDHHVGLDNSAESREKNDRLIAEWVFRGRQPIEVATPPENGLLIDELLLKFADHANRCSLLHFSNSPSSGLRFWVAYSWWMFVRSNSGIGGWTDE